MIVFVYAVFYHYTFWNTEARAFKLVDDLEDKEKLKKAMKTNVEVSTRTTDDGVKNELANVPKLKNGEPMVSIEIFVCSLFKSSDVKVTNHKTKNLVSIYYLVDLLIRKGRDAKKI